MSRHTEILDFLCEQETASVGELVERFGVSRMTIHRDLDRMVEQRFVRKVRGGVTAAPSVVFESNYHYRVRRCLAEKRAIAARIAEYVEPGMTLMLDDSSTTAALVDLLAERAPLTVISHAAGVVESLRAVDGMAVICLGGRFDPTMNAYSGVACEAVLERLNADLAIFSASGLRDGRVYLQDDALVRIKRGMKHCADRSLLGIDGSKFGKSALHLFEKLTAFDHVITDASAPAEQVEQLRADEVHLDVVAVSPEFSAPMGAV